MSQQWMVGVIPIGIATTLKCDWKAFPKTKPHIPRAGSLILHKWVGCPADQTLYSSFAEALFDGDVQVAYVQEESVATNKGDQLVVPGSLRHGPLAV